MDDEITRCASGWTIHVRPQQDVTLPWRCVAFDQSGNGFNVQGFSREHCVTLAADKLGIDPQQLLREFGFST